MMPNERPTRELPEWLKRLSYAADAVPNRHMYREVLTDEDELPLLVVMTFDEDSAVARERLERIMAQLF